MTGEELKSARKSLGLTAEGFAQLVQVQSGRTVRRWEAEEREIPGPVIVLAKALIGSAWIRQYFGLSGEFHRDE